MRTAAATAPGYNPLATAGSGGYNPEWQRRFSYLPCRGFHADSFIDEQICEFLDTVISIPHINPALQKNYVDVLSRMVSLVINGALALERCTPILGKLDPERAGICMLRY